MKNNLFKKFSALFLTGTMLAGVGCKDYDDDINDLKGQIDDLKGKIELKADASALQTITEKLQGIDFTKFLTSDKLDEKLSGYLKSDQLAGKIEAYGYQTKKQVQDLISAQTHLTESKVQDLISAQFTAANIWSKIQGDFKNKISTALTELDPSLSTKQKAEAVAAVLAALKDDTDVAGVRKAIAKLVGDQFEGYMSNYMQTNEKEWVKNVGTAAAKAIDEQATDLKSAILSLIKSNGQLTNDKTVAYLNKTDIEAKFQEFEQAIAKLTADVTALMEQIQSLVNVPEKVNGTTSMAAYNVGEAKIGNYIAQLTYRVTPAALAEEIVGFYVNGKAAFEMVSEKVTRAGEPASVAAEITDVAYVEDGKFSVTISADREDMDALALSEKSIALALSIRSTVNPAAETEKEGEYVSPVENNVLSDFAGITYQSDGKAVDFSLFTTDETPVKYDFEDIAMPFSTSVEASKVTLLEGTQLLASLDGKKYMTLDELNKMFNLNGKLTAGKYEVTPKYYADQTEVTVQGDIDKFIIKAATSKLDYNSKLATVEFRKEATKDDVLSKVELTHSIEIYIDGKTTKQKVTGVQNYTVSNQKGATLNFGDLKPKQWNYAFVSKGMAENTTTPAFDANEFGELKLTLSEGQELPENVTVQKIIDEANLTSKSIKVEGKADNNADFKFESFVSQIAMGVKVSAEKDKYAWGTEKKARTYTIEYIYTYENIDYTLKGSITFGTVPSPVSYTIAPVKTSYEDKTITDSWAKAYADWNKSGYFSDAAEFAAAIFANNASPATETKYYKTASTKNGIVVDPADGTKMTVDRSTLKGELKKTDIKEDGNKFVQTANWTTWYGQKISVTMTYNVELPAYELNYNTQYVIDENGKKVVVLKGQVNDKSVWAWDNANLPAYFNVVTPAGAAELTLSFERVSEDGKDEAGKPDAEAKYATVTQDDKLDWSAAKRDYVDLKAIITIKGTSIKVGEKALRVRIETPIKTLAQTAGIVTNYVPNAETEINLFENLQLIDANGKEWIVYDQEAEEWKAVTVDNTKTAYEVFKAESGNTTSAGIEFKILKAENSDKTPTKLDLLKVENNKLVYQNNSAVLQLDFTVTLQATFKYQYGKVESKTMTVTVKH